MPQTYLTALTSRVFWSPPDSERDRPIMGALAGSRCTLIVEGGASPSHALQFRSALDAQRVAPPHFTAVTHWHWDHVFGATGLSGSGPALPVIGHVETRRRVLEMARLDWRDHALDARVAAGVELEFIANHLKAEMTSAERGALTITAPEITFTGQVELDLGDLTAQIFHVGGDHSPDSSVIYSPEERVAFLGDCFYCGFTGDADFYTLPRLFPLLDRLTALPAEFFVLSHDPAPLPRAEFLREVGRLRRIGALVEIHGGDREAILAHLPAELGQPVSEDDLANLNAFMKGLTLDASS